jgi:S-adenosylmethionine:tRNA ribosyltransferase-isomerase
MLVSDFDFVLPPELIAQRPPAVRGTSRMLQMDRRTGAWHDRTFAELPKLLMPGDLLVLNDTRVLPARLFATRAGLRTQAGSPKPEGVVEVLLTENLGRSGEQLWRALVKPAKKVPVGEVLFFGERPGAEPLLRAEVVAEGGFGERTLRFDAEDEFYQVLERIGSLPLPPYIHRDREEPNTAEDRERYQTVYSQAGEQRSAAAPTAGLHFTPEVLQQLEAGGVEIARITLHVGLGTFQPVRVERTEDIRLHAEPYTLAAEAAAALNRAWAERRRIVAVGTTTTRTLEHVARQFEARNGVLAAENPLRLEPHTGTTGLFLSPGPEGDDQFKLVGGLLTNFHLPQSTLLMLVSAFAGRENALAAYRHAVEQRYRFFSYGDCMLIL